MTHFQINSFKNLIIFPWDFFLNPIPQKAFSFSGISGELIGEPCLEPLSQFSDFFLVLCECKNTPFLNSLIFPGRERVY